MKKVNTLFLILLSIIILGGCVKNPKILENVSPVKSISDHQIVTAQIADSQNLQLEVVNTPTSISQGLSGRDQIGADGMLFVFGQPLTPQFWMKEMEFDLDLVWIKDMKIVKITQNVPAPDLSTPLNQLPTYAPGQPVNMVLEVEAGNAQQWGLSVGDEIQRVVKSTCP